MAASSKTPDSGGTFESAMERLEKIVAQMESAQMPLDELLERYEEGTRLIAVCQEKLKTAEQRIEIVTRKAAEPAPSSSTTFPNEPDVSLF
ncbi:MAG TPA: exodeoxyribonuclease VII small subunit [Chthoniobacterales bacterium]|jgi:exodeoxyribonuclease VII small subunit